MARHEIDIEEAVWRIAAASGNASAYIEKAVKAQYLNEIESEARAIVAALPQSEIDDWLSWGSSFHEDAAEGQQ